MDIHIKKLEENDIDNMKTIIENDNKVFNKKHLEDFIKDKNNYGFIAITENRIVAFLYGYKMLRPDGNNMFYIHSVDVLPEYQSQGIGTKLMEYTVNYIKTETKSSKYFVLTDNDNVKACKLYSKFANSNQQVMFFKNFKND